MLKRRSILIVVLILVLAGAVGFGLFYVGSQLPFSSRPPSPGNDLGRLLAGLVLGLALGLTSAGATASTLLKRYQLPLAQVPWYVFSMAYAPVFFVTFDVLV
jgi:hypothetical protein